MTKVRTDTVDNSDGHVWACLKERISLFCRSAEDRKCRDWLEKRAGAAGKTYRRWANEENPSLELLQEVCEALNNEAENGTSPLDPPLEPLTIEGLLRCVEARRNALNNHSPDPRLAAKLKAEMEALLEHCPDLLRAMIAQRYTHGQSNPTASNVADALLASQVDKAISDVAGLMSPRVEHSLKIAEPCRRLLGCLLAVGVDWVDFHKRDLGNSSNGALELTLLTKTVAEVAVARHEMVPCEFAPVFYEAEEAEGLFRLPDPAGRFAPMFGNMDVNTPELLKHTALGLAHEHAFDTLGPLERYPFWKRIRQSHPNLEVFQKIAARHIKAQIGRGRRFYLLFIDEQVEQYAKRNDLDHHWASLVTVLTTALPEARAVRLKLLRDESHDEKELDLADLISAANKVP
ncbi:MAG: hypothetical protein IPK82_10755 [Polyangiaceae bacterium]|nr:hypothetical protein [Polyangiaceae bacterium]